MIDVSWDDIANEYLPWLSAKSGRAYRLLSEAEWEYAARAGTTTQFSTGATIDSDQANFNGAYGYVGSAARQFRQRTMDVGSFRPNAFGLHDMHGNASEWVEDCWHANYKGAPTDGSAWTSSCTEAYRVIRGGDWANSAHNLRSASRNRSSQDNRRSTVDRGFRVASTLF